MAFEGFYAMNSVRGKEEPRSSDLVRLRVSYFAGEKRQRPNAVGITYDLSSCSVVSVKLSFAAVPLLPSPCD